ncbi:prepilin peptidase CpaA [Pasteurella testudinis DSM 23072]|uniref:Prepilin peptidase CpaA n=1 Tax=Pasteurella testudinis DSM 23072 TaxID=1122938 RepID=A0A1W1UDU0_9PAST|nr:prepilin peptidase [Pasteurella testudinis]SMB78944.1 prepilin peptidase CpaA [Pasteurella testudinis DSM 23072]SUB52455.1 Flp pilus assembly protein, protease CpaA [Pasteurella testudinis]
MGFFLYSKSILLILIVILLIILSWSDINQRIISNSTVLTLLIFIVPFSFLFHGDVFISNALISLVIGFMIFYFGVIGGGDIKLISVLMLATPTNHIVPFLFLTSIVGLLLIIVGWIFFRHSIKENGLPYGVAISAGFLLTLWGVH